MSGRYGKERVKRGLLHFALGKVVSAVAGLLAMVLVVRGLSVPEFANYSVLIALVEVFAAISGLGLVHVVLRYVPELYATHRPTALRSVILATLGLRTGVLLALLLLAYALSQPLAHLIKVDTALPAFKLFLLVVAFRSSSNFLLQILESTLHQGFSQTAFSLAAIGRCLGMLWLLHDGGVSLIDVIALEAICEAFACGVLLVGIGTVLWPVGGEQNLQHDDRNWWSSQRGTVAKFAVTAYLQHLATLPFGGNTNRLVGGVMFGDRVMASFGFAQSICEYFKRYLPTQLLLGLIRPIVVARYSVSRNFSSAATLCDQALHINLVFLFGAVAVLLVAGDELLSLISAGKYGAESVWLLIAMLVLLGLETQRLIIEVLTQSVKHYELMIPSNLFLSASVLLGIAFYPVMGAVAFPIANGLALLCANYWLIGRLANLGYDYSHAWRGTGILCMMFLASVSAGFVSKWLGASWGVVSLITGAIYSGLFARYILHDSILFARELVGKTS